MEDIYVTYIEALKLVLDFCSGHPEREVTMNFNAYESDGIRITIKPFEDEESF